MKRVVIGSLVDGFFDVLQVNSVGAESADILHRDLVGRNWGLAYYLLD